MIVLRFQTKAIQHKCKCVGLFFAEFLSMASLQNKIAITFIYHILIDTNISQRNNWR